MLKHNLRELKRRAIGVVIAAVPLVLLVTSLVFGAIHDRPPTHVAMAIVAGGALIAGFNFYLSFVRPLLLRYLLRRSQNDLRFVSGVPFVGTLLVCAGAVLGFGDDSCALVGIAAFFLDTGGIAWFVISTWRDRSLWDE